jgi:hypothetical protein
MPQRVPATLAATRGIGLLPAVATVGALGLAGALLALYRRHVASELARPEGVHGIHLWTGERGPVESIQLAVLGGLAVQGALLIRKRRALGWIILLAALTVFAREVDWLLEGHVHRHAHRPLMGIFVAALAFVAWSDRRALGVDLRAMPGACCALLACAVLLIIAAQVLGHPEVWTFVARDGEAVRVAKRFVEEGLETLAYLVALASAVVLGRSLQEKPAVPGPAA